MTVESARAYDAEARRARADRILDAASELLQRWGYKRITMDDVAEHAGIGKGTIYLHWNTREALFEAVLQRELGQLVQLLIAAIRRDPENALPHRLGRLYFATIMQRPLLRAVFTYDLRMLGKLAKSEPVHTMRINQMRLDYIQLLVDQGIIGAEIPPQDLAWAFRTIFIGFFLVDPIFDDDQHRPGLERKADLLEVTLQRTFQLEVRPSKPAVDTIAEHMIRLFQEVANTNLTDLGPAANRRS